MEAKQMLAGGELAGVPGESGHTLERRTQMDPMERAERRYRDTLPAELIETEVTERFFRFPLEKICAWIDDYVLPAVEEVCDRPFFRDHATWPQRTLAPGADTPEREAVERVDRALVGAAKALRKLARSASVAGKLNEMAERASKDTHPEIARITAGSNQTIAPARLDPLAWIPGCLDQLDAMAGRCWTDLVCAEDYFGPTGKMLRTESLPAGVTEGAFVVSLTPRLYFVGDSITRSLMHRIRSWQGALEEAKGFCQEALRTLKKPPAKLVEAEHSAWRELQEAVAELQTLCLAGNEARIREASIILVQVYAEFHPRPQLDWLGIPDWAVLTHRGSLRRQIEVRDLETLDRIAGALGDVRLLYRESRPEEAAVDQAIGTGGLVLVEKDREAYWQGQRIAKDWRRYRKAWELLWQLAMNAKVTSPVGNFDLYQDGKPDSTIHSRWHRLKPLLPSSLRKYVERGVDKATYRLNYRSHRIFVFPLRTAPRGR